MTYLIRGTVLSELPELIAERGGDPEGMLRAHGVDPSTTEDFDRFVRFEDTAGVIGDVAHRLDFPDIGMELARRQNLQVLGPLAVILRNAETVGDAIDRVGRSLHNIVFADTVRLTRTDRMAVYTYETDLSDGFERSQMVEKSLALAVKAIGAMIGKGFEPLRVTFQHRQIAPIGCYRESFLRLPEFGSEQNTLHLSLRDIARPLPNRDPIALALAEDVLKGFRAGREVADQVRHQTRKLLLVEEASLSEVARAMSLHPRVVQRRLAEEGTTFERILDDVRRARAWDLAATEMQATQIAHALGYSEQSSYSRACRRWFGESPRELQSRRRGSMMA